MVGVGSRLKGREIVGRYSDRGIQVSERCIGGCGVVVELRTALFLNGAAEGRRHCRSRVVGR